MEMTSGIVLAAQFTSITTLGNFFVIFLRLEIEHPRLNSRLAFSANPLISGIPSLSCVRYGPSLASAMALELGKKEGEKGGHMFIT